MTISCNTKKPLETLTKRELKQCIDYERYIQTKYLGGVGGLFVAAGFLNDKKNKYVMTPLQAVGYGRIVWGFWRIRQLEKILEKIIRADEQRRLEKLEHKDEQRRRLEELEQRRRRRLEELERADEQSSIVPKRRSTRRRRRRSIRSRRRRRSTRSRRLKNV